MSAESSFKRSFCGFLFDLDNEYQAQNEESDDWDKIGMSRDKGIAFLNESKCLVISIC